MSGFVTTMNGRFRRAWIRWANLHGRIDRVKFADAKRDFGVIGGRPCFARSARVGL